MPARLDSKTSYLRVSVPENLDLALEGLIRKVLREQPPTEDIYRFAADYFETLLRLRDELGFQAATSQLSSSLEDKNKDNSEMLKLASNFPKPPPEKIHPVCSAKVKTNLKKVPKEGINEEDVVKPGMKPQNKKVAAGKLERPKAPTKGGGTPDSMAEVNRGAEKTIGDKAEPEEVDLENDNMKFLQFDSEKKLLKKMNGKEKFIDEKIPTEETSKGEKLKNESEVETESTKIVKGGKETEKTETVKERKDEGTKVITEGKEDSKEVIVVGDNTSKEGNTKILEIQEVNQITEKYEGRTEEKNSDEIKEENGRIIVIETKEKEEEEKNQNEIITKERKEEEKNQSQQIEKTTSDKMKERQGAEEKKVQKEEHKNNEPEFLTEEKEKHLRKKENEGVRAVEVEKLRQTQEGKEYGNDKQNTEIEDEQKKEKAGSKCTAEAEKGETEQKNSVEETIPDPDELCGVIDILSINTWHEQKREAGDISEAKEKNGEKEEQTAEAESDDKKAEEFNEDRKTEVEDKIVEHESVKKKISLGQKIKIEEELNGEEEKVDTSEEVNKFEATVENGNEKKDVCEEEIENMDESEITTREKNNLENHTAEEGGTAAASETKKDEFEKDKKEKNSKEEKINESEKEIASRILENDELKQSQADDAESEKSSKSKKTETEEEQLKKYQVKELKANESEEVKEFVFEERKVTEVEKVEDEVVENTSYNLEKSGDADAEIKSAVIKGKTDEEEKKENFEREGEIEIDEKDKMKNVEREKEMRKNEEKEKKNKEEEEMNADGKKTVGNTEEQKNRFCNEKTEIEEVQKISEKKDKIEKGTPEEARKENGENKKEKNDKEEKVKKLKTISEEEDKKEAITENEAEQVGTSTAVGKSDQEDSEKEKERKREDLAIILEEENQQSEAVENSTEEMIGTTENENEKRADTAEIEDVPVEAPKSEDDGISSKKMEKIKSEGKEDKDKGKVTEDSVENGEAKESETKEQSEISVEKIDGVKTGKDEKQTERESHEKVEKTEEQEEENEENICDKEQNIEGDRKKAEEAVEEETKKQEAATENEVNIKIEEAIEDENSVNGDEPTEEPPTPITEGFRPRRTQIKTIETHYYDLLRVPETVTKEFRLHRTREDQESSDVGPQGAEEDFLSIDTGSLDSLTAFLDSERRFSSWEKEPPIEDDVEGVIEKTTLPSGSGASPDPPREHEEVSEEGSPTEESKEGNIVLAEALGRPEAEAEGGRHREGKPNVEVEIQATIDVSIEEERAEFPEAETEGSKEVQSPIRGTTCSEDAESERKEFSTSPAAEDSSGRSDSATSSATTEIRKSVERGSSQSLLATKSTGSMRKRSVLRTRSLSNLGTEVSDSEVWKAIEKELEIAAQKIQAEFRGYAARKKLRREDAVRAPTEESSGGATPEPERCPQRSTGEFHDSVLLPVHPR